MVLARRLERARGSDGGDLHSVFKSYNGHLLALPIWTYRGMLNLFGLRWGAFLVIVVTLHVALVCLLRMIMRRLGVSPWTATVVAGIFVFYGRAKRSCSWPFLIERVGVVLLGCSSSCSRIMTATASTGGMPSALCLA